MSNRIGFKEQIYYSSPVCIQNLLCCIKGYFIRKRRYSKEFMQCLKLYESKAFDGHEELRRFLQKIADVPYYKRLYKEKNFNPNAENLQEEIRKLPVLTRAEVIANKRDIVNPYFKGPVLLSSTGGTTGAGLEFPLSIEAEHKQWAVCWRYRENLGIKWDTWHGWFGGKIIIPVHKHKPPYWRINYPCRQVMFSSLHLSEETVAFFHKCIYERKLSWLHGYSCNLNLLAVLILKMGLKPIDTVSFVTTGSDNLLDSYRKTIKKAFPNAQVCTHYAMSECVANISETKDGRMFVDEDFAYMELLPFDDEKPQLRKIIGTGFVNYAFPLVRYDTGDVAAIDYDNNGEMYITRIEGREAEYLKLSNGQKIGVTFIDNFESFKKIKAAQIYQPDINTLIIRVEKNADYDLNEEWNIIKEVKERLSCPMNITVEYVDKIERTKSGKLRLIISDI